MRTSILFALMLGLVLSATAWAQPTLTVTDGLLVRLETVGTTTATLSGSNVTSWHDQAALGGSQDATDGGIATRQPLYLTAATPIGKDALDFDGASDYLSIVADDSLATDTVTWFIVFKYDALGAAPMLLSTETDAPSDHSWRSFSSTTTFFNSSRSTAGSAINSSTPFSDTANWHLLSAVWNGGAATPDFGTDTIQGWLDNTAMSVGSGANGTPTAHSWTTIGSQNGILFSNSKMSAVLIYNRVLTPAEIDAVETYLTGTYLQDPGVPPEVDSIELLDPATTSQDMLDFAVTFNKGVTLEEADIQLDGTLAPGATIAISGSAADWTVRVTPTDPDADGTLGITVLTTVEDIFLQALTVPASSALYQVDGYAPLVVYDAEAGASPADPATVGWVEDFVSGTDDQTTALLDGGVVDAWRVFDAGVTRAAYQVVLEPEDLDGTSGWTMTARSRTLYANGIFQSTFFLEDGADRWVAHFDNPDPDAVPPADAGERVYSDGITLPLNVSGDRGTNKVAYVSPWLPSDPANFSDDTPVYHTYQILYDPATSSARFLVDGEEFGTVPDTAAAGVSVRRAFFGSSSGGAVGDSTWNYVALHEGQQPVPWVDSAAFQALDVNVSTVTLDLAFTTAVSGVDVSDFDLITTGVTGASIVDVNVLSATSAEVIVDYGTGEGELVVRLVDDNSIVNAVGFPFSGRDLKNFESGILNTPGDPPTVTAITLLDPSPTALDTLDFSVSFDSDVNFSDSDVQVDGTLASGAGVVVTGGPADWTVSVTPSDPLADGSLGITVLTSVTNLIGQSLVASSSSAQYQVDGATPLALYDAETGASPADPATVGWDVDSLSGTDDQTTALLDGGVVDAWRIYDAGSLSRAAYLVPFDAGDLDGAVGWTMTARSRTLFTSTTGDFLATFFLEDGSDRWVMHFKNIDPDAVPPVDATEGVSSNGIGLGLNVSGSRGATSATYASPWLPSDPALFADDSPVYHTYQMLYDPATSSTRFLVDGEEFGTVSYTAAGNVGAARAFFGSSSGGGISDTTWNYVALHEGWQPVPWVDSAVFQTLDPNVSTVTLDLVFTTAVSGLDVSDFDLITTGVTGASVVGVNVLSGTAAEVVVDYGTGEGELALRLVDDNSIVNVVGLPFSGRDLKDYVSGTLVTPGAPPTVQAITLLDPQQTGADLLRFGVSFDADVNFDDADVQVDGSLAAGTTVTVAGAPADWTVSVELADPLAEGDLGITVLTSVTNLASQFLAAPASSALYEVANRYPVVVYDAAIGTSAQDPRDQGWTLDLPLASSTTLSSAVDGDGTPAWRVYDWSGSSRAAYISDLAPAYFSASEGWHVRIRARALATQLPFGVTTYVNDGQTYWNVTLRNDQPATAYPADTSEAAYSFASPSDPDGFILQMDVAGTTGTVMQDYWQAPVGGDLADDVPTYNEYVMYYDPAGGTSGTLTYYVNDQEVDVLDRADAWNVVATPRILFGSSSSGGRGDSLWNYVAFTVGAPQVEASAETWQIFE